MSSVTQTPSLRPLLKMLERGQREQKEIENFPLPCPLLAEHLLSSHTGTAHHAQFSGCQDCRDYASSLEPLIPSLSKHYTIPIPNMPHIDDVENESPLSCYVSAIVIALFVPLVVIIVLSLKLVQLHNV